MAKEIKLKISLDGANKVEAQIDDIGDGLHDLDVRDAKNAKQALENLDKTNLNQLKSEIKSASSTLKEFGSKVHETGQTISNFGQTATVAITAPILAMATFGITSQATLEKAEVSFARFIKNSKGFAGSMDDAKQAASNLMKELQSFADTTPFESEEVISSGRKLLAAKIPKEEIKSFLVDAGDLAAAANASIEDVAGAMSRLKSGDFGEAFERFRDFGISKEDLTGKGLKFDGSGQYKGSVDEAMTAVRAIIKERFGGTMEDLSQTMSGRFSTLMDKGKAFFRELFLPAFEYAKPAIDFVVAQLEFLTSYLTQLSPQTKFIIVAILGFLAALAPVAVVIGAVVSAIGGLITAIGTIAGAVAALGGVAPAVLIVGAAFAQIAVIAGTVAVAAFAIYEVWETNFGNIRGVVADFQSMVSSAFNSLMAIVQPAIDEVSSYATDGFNQIKQWWAENGAEISKAAEAVFRFLLNLVKNELETIKNFWAVNGQQITEIVRASWNIVKTIISTFVSQIGNVIKLITAIINGNWSGAWSAFKAIVQTGVNGALAILRSIGTIILNIFSAIGASLYEIGKNIIEGLINGIKSKASEAYDAAHSLITSVVGVMRNVPIIRSPSKVTTEIGQFLVDGLIFGMKNRSVQAVNTAKKLAEDLLKEFRDAAKEFSKLAGASPEMVANIQETDRIREAINAQSEIIKLRKELGLNNWKELPVTVSDTEAELKYLQLQKKAAEDFLKSLDEIADGVEKTKELLNEENEQRLQNFKDKKIAIEQDSEFSLLKLQEEIDLLGVTDDFEKIRIQNSYELKRLRQELMNDGYEEDQINEIVALTDSEQRRLLELQRIIQVRKEALGASDLGKDLNDKLTSLQNGGRELSEVEKTIRRLDEDFKNISPQQREQILNTAAQIDAQKRFNEEYQKTYDFVRGALDILTEKGKSFDEKMKTIFGNVFNYFKKMLLDMAAQAITTNIFGKSSGNSGGFNIGGLLNGIFGGGSSTGGSPTGGYSTPPFANNFSSSGNSNVSSQIGSLANNINSVILHERTAALENASNGTRSRIVSGVPINDITAQVASTGKFSFGSLAGGLGAIAPMLGMSLGGMVSPSGGLGGILGSAGGLLGGVAAMGLLAPTMLTGLFGSLGLGLGASLAAASAATVVGLVAAPILLLGGWLIGRSKQRRQEEIQRTQVINDAFGQLDEILKQVNSDKMDGQSGIAQANSIRQQYLQQVSQLKDTKTRNIALKDVSRLDPKIDAIRQAAGAQDTRKNIAEKWIPVYASGTYMDSGFLSQYGEFKRRNGMLPGAFTGIDTLPSLLAAGEMVLNPSQIEAVRRRAGFDAFAGAGIPNYKPQTQPLPKFAAGVNLNYSAVSPSTSAKQEEPTINNFEFHIDAEGLVSVGLKSNRNQKQVIGTVKSFIKKKG